MLHNCNSRSNAQTAKAINAPAIDTQTFTRTVVKNYALCQQNDEQLKALQEWVRGVSDADP